MVDNAYSQDEDVYTLQFTFHSDLCEVEQFADHFEKEWAATLPQTRIEQLGKRFQGILQTHGLANLLGAASAVGSIAVPNAQVLSGIRYLLQRDGQSDENITYSSIFVEFLEEFNEEHPDATLVLLFEGYENIPEENREEFDRLFESISQRVPTGVVCCLACSDRAILGYDSAVREIHLDAFSSEEVGLYLQEAGFETTPSLVEEIHTLTSGNPYYVKRFVQEAIETSIEDAKENAQQAVDVEQYLEDAFLRQMGSEKEQFLRNTCALPELRLDIVAQVIGNDYAEVRTYLQELHDEYIVQKIGVHGSTPIYSVHSLLHDHLYDQLPDEQVKRQHRTCASFHLKQLSEGGWTEKLEEFVWSLLTQEEAKTDSVLEFVNSASNCLAHVVLFDFHINQISSDNREKEIARLLQNSDVTQKQAMNTLGVYYLGNENVDWSQVKKETTDIDPSDITRDDLDGMKVGEQLYRDFCYIKHFSGMLSSPTNSIEEINAISKRCREAADSDQYGIAASILYIIAQEIRIRFYSGINNEKGAKLEQELNEFVADTIGLTQQHSRCVGSMLRAIDNQLDRTRDWTEKTNLSQDAKLDTYGIQGGIQSGTRAILFDSVEEFIKSRTSTSPITRNWPLIRNALFQSSIYFNEEGFEAIAAILSDIKNIGDMAFGGQEPSKESITLNFTDTEAFQQIQQLLDYPALSEQS